MGLFSYFSYSSELTIDSNEEKAFDIVLYSITHLENTKINRLVIDKPNQIIKFEIDNWHTLGENITISFEKISNNQTKISMNSAYKTWTLFFSYPGVGHSFYKNRQNIELISNTITRNLKYIDKDYNFILSENQKTKYDPNKKQIDKYLVWAIIVSIIVIGLIFLAIVY